MRRCALLLLAALSAIGREGAAEPAVPHQLRACGDAGEYPPLTYFERQAGHRTGRIGGFNAEYLPGLLALTGRTVAIELLPWKRCLALVEEGKIDIVLDSGTSAARQRQFRLAAPHVFVTNIVMYAAARPVAAPPDTSSLMQLRRCEMLGWDNTRIGLPAPSDQSSYPATIGMGLAMLRAGRCEAMLTQAEVVDNLHRIEGEDWRRGMVYHALPFMARTGLAYGVSRAVPYSEPLRGLLNAGHEKMRASGQAAHLLARYGLK